MFLFAYATGMRPYTLPSPDTFPPLGSARYLNRSKSSTNSSISTGGFLGSQRNECTDTFPSPSFQRERSTSTCPSPSRRKPRKPSLNFRLPSCADATLNRWLPGVRKGVRLSMFTEPAMPSTVAFSDLLRTERSSTKSFALGVIVPRLRLRSALNSSLPSIFTSPAAGAN